MKMVMSVAGIIMLLFLYGCSSEVQDKEQILIHSIPGNLQIHVAMGKTTQIDLEGKDFVRYFNTTDEKHYVMDESNLAGKSPIVLNDMQPGHYLIAVEPAEFYERSATPKNRDPFLPIAAVVTSVDVGDIGVIDRIRDGSTKVSGALIYLFEKKEGKRGIVTIHAQNSYSLSELESGYPTGTNFTYDTTRINAQLEEANFLSLFDSTEMASTLDLLSRNGQVVAQKGDIKFLIDITDEQDYSVETWGNVAKD